MTGEGGFSWVRVPFCYNKSPLNAHGKCAEKSCKLSEHAKSQSKPVVYPGLTIGGTPTSKEGHQLPMWLCFICMLKQKGCTPVNFPMQCMLICWLSGPRSLLPSLHCLHEGCPEGKPAVHTLIQFTLLLVEKTGVAPHVTLRFTACKQECRWENYPGFEDCTKSKIGAINGLTKCTLVQNFMVGWDGVMLVCKF